MQELLVVLDVFEQAFADEHLELVRMVRIGSRTRPQLTPGIEQFGDLVLALR